MKKLGSIYQSIALAAALMICLVVSFVAYTGALRRNYQTEIVSTLEEVSSQNQTILENDILMIQEVLAETSRRISLYEPEGYPLAVEGLLDTCQDSGFKRMGIILPDGTAYTTDRKIINLGDREFFARSMRGERYTSGPLEDRIAGGSINVYSVPVYGESGITAVLFATYGADTMQKELTIPSFHGQGYTYVVASNGDVIVKSDNKNSPDHMENVFDTLLEADPQNQGSAEKLKEDLTQGNSGCVKFGFNGQRYLYYTPICVNDWYLLTVAPAIVLDQKMNAVLGRTYLLGAFLLALFLLILTYLSKVQKKQRQQLLDAVYVDPLTGGYTFQKFMIVAVKLAQRPDSGPYAVLDIDIDGFKFVNEYFGYEEGDLLIRYIHQILKQWCTSGECYAHKTSDVFTALILDTDPEITEKRIKDLERRLRGYLEGARERIQVVPSIGIFRISDPTFTMDYCLDCAGIARKSIKGKYDVGYAFYDEALKQRIFQEKIIESEMEEALRNHEFVVYYQPQYDTHQKKIVGAEGLVRWKRQNGELVSPGEFIPLFEKNGFITRLDEYMFRTICGRQKEWLDMGARPVPVSVNLSRMQLYDLNFVDRYEKILKELELPVRYVEMEITESVFFDNQPQITEAIDRLHKAGFVILLDDFGTGYSSMSMLKDMWLDTLKIDKGFVDSIGDPRGDKVVDGILRLADSLGLSTIAEGVETREQFEYLKLHGCDMIQGFYFGKPMPAESFYQLISNDNHF